MEEPSPHKNDLKDDSLNLIKSTTDIIRRPLRKTQQKSIESMLKDVKISTYKIPDEPKDPEKRKLWYILKEFVEDEEKTEYEFPSTLGSTQRKLVHSLAEEFELEHFSRGSKVRYITVEKKHNKKEDEWQYFSYIGLFGPSVDKSAQNNTSEIPPQMIQKRIKRDGPINHITLLTKDEVIALTKRIEDIKVQFKEQVPIEQIESVDSVECLINIVSHIVTDDWQDLGVGVVKQPQNEAYFKVIEWETASNLRKALGLPKKDFHITVAFAKWDIHEVPKDRSTLLSNNNDTTIVSSLNEK